MGQPAVPAGRLVRSPGGALTRGKDKKAKGRCGQEARERWSLGWPLGGGEDQLAALPGPVSRAPRIPFLAPCLTCGEKQGV